MELILEVVSHLGAPPAVPLSARFDESGGSIGRRADNHLILPDEEKIIGRNHGNIRCENGVFIYSDTSLNGTELCGKGRLLVKESAPLADGDCLKIGDYELQVHITGGGPTDLGLGLDSAMPSFAPDIDIPSAVGPGFDFGESPLAASHPSAPDFAARPEAAPVQGHFTPPSAQQIPEDFSFDEFWRENHGPAGEQSPPAMAEPDATDDWMKAWVGGVEDTQPPHPAPTATPATPVELRPVPFSFELESQPQPAGPLVPPSQQPAGDATLAVGPQELPGPAGADRSAAVPAAPAPVEAQAVPASDLSQAPTQQIPWKAFAEEQAAGLNMPKPGGRPAVSSVGRPSPFAEPAPAPAAPAAPPPTSTPVVEADLFQCFLDGAGLAEFPNMGPAERAETMKTLGLVFRHMVDGMMAVLQARAEEKREIRADVTLIRGDKNNPLKWFPKVEGTMSAMLHRKYAEMGFIDSVSAIQEGFDDIMNHQLAMRAAMQASLDQILGQFDPAVLEQSVEGGVFQSKKAKCWDAYVEAYPKLMREAMEGLFGPAFAQAYEEQVRRLRKARGQ